MPRKLLPTMALLLFSTSLPALADATDDLLQHLNGLVSLTGEFSQQQYPEGSTQPISSEGQFKLLRPDYFSWEITAPDSQLIIATPEYIWQHDRDLETVTRRPVAGSEKSSPLQVLAGEEAALRAGYTVEQAGPGRFRLTPTASGADFRQLEVEFAGNTLTGMEILDNLGQRVDVEFSHLVRDAPLGKSDFDFTPPKGADLFYYDE
ncbi:outer membrane lipoprotein chaperone LolA [Parahaliea maris]|uniref:Outer-membrane lipoprotein carrier protein n=1 Tax=Parahaliea maris TaxID=2716870 RepID=A0A5C9A4D3_9GAMM|nr:outer membrane lipoprotein chaperone LolA [Parahaliea maris]TXS95763.1 outer membrane lipoprotein chaperone LolA [Parahaliea maris]